jgi:NAD(P)-dependent dehydrogenase (short-subunit alcohol dehydrogenase family)
MRLKDKVVIISGASGGLGQGVTRLFVAQGAKVVLVGSRLEKVERLANALDSSNTLSLAADLTVPTEAERVVSTTLDTYSRVDILLNLAGGFTGGVPVHETDNTDLQKMLNINLYTTYNLCRAAVKPMIAQQWGRIVNTASRDALKGRAKFSAYAISKAAVLRLTEALAEEVKDYNVTVNAILPGIIDTEANRKVMPKANFEKWVKPTTIAETLLFLVSENSAITGAAIPLFEQV